MKTKDYGKEPYIVNIEQLTKENDKFRITKWTGRYLQMTVMSIVSGGEVGLEVHHDHDQFLRIEQGIARVQMGESEDKLDFVREAKDNDAVFVPAGYWHNITNIGDEPVKLYSLYAPPEHKAGTIHESYEDDPEH